MILHKVPYGTFHEQWLRSVLPGLMSDRRKLEKLTRKTCTVGLSAGSMNGCMGIVQSAVRKEIVRKVLSV